MLACCLGEISADRPGARGAAHHRAPGAVRPRWGRDQRGGRTPRAAARRRPSRPAARTRLSLGPVWKVSPGLRRLPRTLAALSDPRCRQAPIGRCRTPGTRTTLRLAIARARRRSLVRRTVLETTQSKHPLTDEVLTHRQPSAHRARSTVWSGNAPSQSTPNAASSVPNSSKAPTAASAASRSSAVASWITWRTARDTIAPE